MICASTIDGAAVVELLRFTDALGIRKGSRLCRQRPARQQTRPADEQQSKKRRPLPHGAGDLLRTRPTLHCSQAVHQWSMMRGGCPVSRDTYTIWTDASRGHLRTGKACGLWLDRGLSLTADFIIHSDGSAQSLFTKNWLEKGVPRLRLCVTVCFDGEKHGYAEP